MFTIKDEMTGQEIFDFVSYFMLDQNRKSIDDNGDLRYHYDGTKCAVGCLIKYDEYRETFEGNTVLNIIEKLPRRIRDNVNIMVDLQRIHDDEFVPDWKLRLGLLAFELDLNDAVLDLFDWDDQSQKYIKADNTNESN